MATKKHKRTRQPVNSSAQTVARIKEIIARSEELLKQHNRLAVEVGELIRETERNRTFEK
jgi:hypothetical protein